METDPYGGVWEGGLISIRSISSRGPAFGGGSASFFTPDDGKAGWRFEELDWEDPGGTREEYQNWVTTDRRDLARWVCDQ